MNENLTVLALGMPRSGSTWQYNAANEVLLQLMEPYAAEPPKTIEEMEAVQRRREFVPRVMKSHSPPKDLAARLMDVETAVLYIYRDIRDVVASYQEFTGATGGVLAGAMRAIVNNHYDIMSWCEGGDHVQLLRQRYDDLLANPHETLQRLASFLKMFVPQHMPSIAPIPFGLEAQIVRDLSIEVVHYRMKDLDYEGSDREGRHAMWCRETLIHGNHISPWEGQPGAWQRLDDESKALALSLHEEMIERLPWDYESKPGTEQPTTSS